MNKEIKKNKGLPIMAIIIVVVVLLVGANFYFSRYKKGVIRTADNQVVKYQQNGEQVKVETEQGSLVVGGDVKLPSDFPENIPVYPKSKLTSAMAGEAPGYTAETKDDFGTVVKWYREELTKKGWKVIAEDQAGLLVQGSEATGSLVVMDGNIIFSSGKTESTE